MKIIYLDREGGTYVARAAKNSAVTVDYLVDKLVTVASGWYAANKNTAGGLANRSRAAGNVMALSTLLVDLKLAQSAATIQHRYLQTRQRCDLLKLPNTRLAELCDTSESSVRRRALHLSICFNGKLFRLSELTQRDNKAAREHDAYQALVGLGYQPGCLVSVRAVSNYLLERGITWKPRALADAVKIAKQQIDLEYCATLFSGCTDALIDQQISGNTVLLSA